MKNAIIVTLILVVLALTNPSKSQYTAWASRNIIPQQEGIMSLLSDARTSLTTVSENLYIATLFTTFRDGKEIKVLGIAGGFIELGDILDRVVLW